MTTPRRYFTMEEDDIIKEMKGNNPQASFSEIAKRLNAKPGTKVSRSQCYQRWRTCLQPQIQSNQVWTQAEDQQLITLLKQYSIDFYLITKGLKRRTRSNVRKRVIFLLKQTVRFLQKHLKPIDDSELIVLAEAEVHRMCYLMTGDIQSKQSQKIKSVRQKVLKLTFLISSGKPFETSGFPGLYDDILNLKDLKIFHDEPPSRKIPPLKQIWFNNQEQRLYQLFCKYGKRFIVISKILRQEFDNKQKYHNQFLRARTIGLMRDGLRKIKNQSEIRNIHIDFNLDKIVKRATARKILALENSQSIAVKETIFGVNFGKKISNQEILKILQFLKWFSGTKSYRHKSASQISKQKRFVQSSSDSQEEQN